MKAINIIWDTDGENISLPTEIDIPEGMTDKEEISDYISNETGFCHKGFELTEKIFEVKAGYYEWNIFCNGELINSLSNGFTESLPENPTLEDIYDIAMDWTDAMFDDFEEDEYDRQDYWDIVKKLTQAWANHLCIDYGEDFESSYHKVAYVE